MTHMVFNTVIASTRPVRGWSQPTQLYYLLITFQLNGLTIVKLDGTYIQAQDSNEYVHGGGTELIPSNSQHSLCHTRNEEVLDYAKHGSGVAAHETVGQ